MRLLRPVVFVFVVVLFGTLLLGITVWPGRLTRAASNQPPLSSPVFQAQQQSARLALTVYNQNLALVRDRRAITLRAGIDQVRFSDVASQIEPTSVLFRSLTDPQGTVVVEQNFEYDLVGSDKLLEKYVDQEVRVVTEDGTEYRGSLLSGRGDIILRERTGNVVVLQRNRVREFTFPRLPEGLITRPTLVWTLRSRRSGTQDVEVTYLTRGVSWRADYVIHVNEDDTAADLRGWITLDNQSGTAYKEAKLKLIAGDVNVIRQPVMSVREGVPDIRATPMPGVTERPLFEYRLYDVPQPVTVQDRQTKQIEFASASGVTVEKFFVYDGARGLRFYGSPVISPDYGATSSRDVGIYIQFENGEQAGLGIPLPAGRVRVYKADVDGSLQFIGEDQIDHTPTGERVRLFLGNAFDIVGERKQTDFRRLGSRTIEESYEIRVRNHKEQAVEVRVVEHMFRWSEWEIVQETEEHTKLDANTVEWRLNVPASDEVVLTYTVRYTLP
ncbi:MAG: DUF4139 domain-containing protein [Ardenticatenia bacterium]|nr:DUF4139 domain-containing protein [Ardenticatenia bacterium]